MYAGNLNRDIPAFFRKPKMEAAVVLLSVVYGNCNLPHLDAERRKADLPLLTLVRPIIIILHKYRCGSAYNFNIFTRPPRKFSWCTRFCYVYYHNANKSCSVEMLTFHRFIEGVIKNLRKLYQYLLELLYRVHEHFVSFD